MNYINVLLAKINHFNRKMADSNYSDIRSFYHSNYSSTKFHICFSPNAHMSSTLHFTGITLFEQLKNPSAHTTMQQVFTVHMYCNVYL